MEKIGIPLALAGGLAVLAASMVANVDIQDRVGYTAQVVDTTIGTTDGTVEPVTSVATNTAGETTTSDSTSAAVFPSTDPTTIPDVPESVVDVATLHCPFNAQTGRTIVDFTHNGTVPVRDMTLRANSTLSDATVSATTYLAPGVYQVLLASFADHTHNTVTDLSERWSLRAADRDGSALDETPPTRDIPDTDRLIIELVDKTFTIPRETVKVVGVHAAFPATTPHSVVALCAALDRVSEGTSADVGTVPVSDPVSVPVVGTELTTTVEQTTAPPAATNPQCPLPPREGRIIVDFTNAGSVPLNELVLRANGTKREATGMSLATYIPKGIYDVRLASYDGSFDSGSRTQQTWRAILLDDTGGIVSTTPASRDVPDWEPTFVSQVAQRFEVAKDVRRVASMHAAYPGTESSVFAVLCASFDRVDSLTPTEAESTTAVGTPSLPTLPAVGSAMTTTTTVVSPKEIPIGTVPPKNVLSGQPVPRGGIDADVVPSTIRESVAVAPATIGVLSHKDGVPVPVQVVAQRQLAVAALREAPLTLLGSASPRQRKEIVQTLLTRTTTTTASDADAAASDSMPPVSLVLARTVREQSATEVVAPPEELTRAAQVVRLRNRNEDAVSEDGDGDGVSDYDEVYLYNTDPTNAFTGGSVLTDGERLLLGFDPKTDDTEVVPVESPRTEGDVIPELFSVDTLETVVPLAQAEQADAVQEDSVAATPIRVAGYTKPYSFVTLYVFSTPIVVTVRSDGDGRFEYTLDEQLEDGSHELYVANVNDAGKIIAKSDPIPFVKTAEAVERTPVSVPQDPVSQSVQTTVTFALLMVLIVTVLSIVSVGMVRTRRAEEEALEKPHDQEQT